MSHLWQGVQARKKRMAIRARNSRPQEKYTVRPTAVSTASINIHTSHLGNLMFMSGLH